MTDTDIDTDTELPHHDSVATVHDQTSAPLFWTTYSCTVDADAAVTTVAGTCAWIATLSTGDAYCWVDAPDTPGPRTVVCTITNRRDHCNHEALIWLLDDAIRRCYVIESETNLTRPRLRVYSVLDEDTDCFDVHHSPSSKLKLCDKYEAKVDDRPIPAYLRTEYDHDTPIYVSSESAPTVHLADVPAPTASGVHDAFLDPDPSVVYSCTGTVDAPDPSTRITFDDEPGQPTPLATDGGDR